MASGSESAKSKVLVSPLDEVASAITQLVGNLGTHMRNLEGVEKSIDEQVRACDRPSVAFKLTDLHTHVHSVLIKVRSYTRTCKDITDFGNSYEEEELQSEEGMLYFISEMKSFSSPMEEQLDAIIKEIEKAIIAVKEQKDIIAATEATAQRSRDETMPPATETLPNEAIHQRPPTHATQHVIGCASHASTQTQMPRTNKHTQQSRSGFNMRNVYSFLGKNQALEHERRCSQKSILEKCEKILNELTVEVERLKREAVEKYTTSIIASLEMYEDADDVETLTEGIRKIRCTCAPSGTLQ